MRINRLLPISLSIVAVLGFTACAPDTSRTGNSASSAEGASSSVDPDGFTVQPTEVKIEGENALKFEYPTTRAARLDAAKLSDDGMKIGEKTMAWIGNPHFFRKENVMVLYVGSTMKVIDALTAQYGAQFAGK